MQEGFFFAQVDTFARRVTFAQIFFAKWVIFVGSVIFAQNNFAMVKVFYIQSNFYKY